MAKKGTPNDKLWAVILAGGKGQRLFPLSNPMKEKQFVWISSETGSLLQNTIRRFISIGVKPTNVVIITTCDRQTQLASDDALSLGVLSQNIYQIAPDLGYTGAMNAGTEFVSRIDANAIIINSPSDQLIEKNASFKDSMQTAIEYASKGSFANVGVRITDLVTYMGTGHMQYDKEGRITKFIEKPDRELADKLMREGNTACNTGINVWRADRFLDAVKGENLKDMPTDKFMEILMRKDLRAVVGTFPWYDCGTLSSLHDVGMAMGKGTPDHHNVTYGNVKKGGTQGTYCHESYIRAESGHRIEAYNIPEAAVIANFINGKPAFVACAKSESQRMREVAEEFERTGTLKVGPENEVLLTDVSDECAIAVIGLPGAKVVVTKGKTPGVKYNWLITMPN
ncbi:hypothetical protein IKQ74_02400 [Candidatus Saccharibacteria bacterium]|jgi:hypothetical protein|nr:hypothetical protein [Candidatus Saccharibacteria bacterium]